MSSLLNRLQRKAQLDAVGIPASAGIGKATVESSTYVTEEEALGLVTLILSEKKPSGAAATAKPSVTSTARTSSRSIERA